MSGPDHSQRRTVGWRLLAPSEGTHRMISTWASTWGFGSGLLANFTPADTPERRFSSTEHLSTEAVAAFVDNELQPTAFLRAAAHLSACSECSAAVDAQRQARTALRHSGEIRIPPDVLRSLRSIPFTTPGHRNGHAHPGTPEDRSGDQQAVRPHSDGKARRHRREA
jgi:hypothetical protein